MRFGRVLRRRAPLVVFALWAALAAGSAVALLQAQRQTREQIQSRFDARATTTARFVETYVAAVAAQERRVATRVLGAATVSRAQFKRAVELFGSSTAGLLDDEGRTLHDYPSATALVEKDVGAHYTYLRAALNGRVGVSNTVSSVSRGVPIIAFAVPFQSAVGRRVFSSGFEVRDTPLSAYLRRAGAVAPNRVFLIDRRAKVVAGNASTGNELETLSGISPALTRSVGTGRRNGHTDEDEAFVVQSVAGTPWRLVMTAPEATLYQAIRGSKRWIPWLLWVGFATGGLACLGLVRRLIASGSALRASNAQLDRLARMDKLTGLANRRSMEELLSSALASAARHNQEVAVLMADVDRFKQVNDCYGHAAGDEALRALAGTLRDQLREGDVVARWGGEEFVVVLPFTDSEGAEVVADRLREAIAETPIPVGGELLQMTISIGCAAWQPDEPLSALLHRSDAALYQAKERGRNRVVSAEAPRRPARGSSDQDLPRARRFDSDVQRTSDPADAHSASRSPARTN